MVANGPYKPTDTTDAAARAQSSYTFKRASWEQADVICNDPLTEYGTAAVVLSLDSIAWRGIRRVGRLQLIHCNVDIFACLGWVLVCWILWTMAVSVEFFLSQSGLQLKSAFLNFTLGPPVSV